MAKGRAKTESKLVITGIALVLIACGGEQSNPAPAPSEPVAPSPTVSESTAPAGPTLEGARTAFSESRYDDVCTYLVGLQFSPDVCAFIAQAAGGTSGTPPEMDAWLESQGVRRLGGVIVGPYDGRAVDQNDDIADEYDVLVNGEPMIVSAMLTAGEVEAIDFEFWMQETGAREVRMGDGNMRSLPLCREWPLYVAIMDLARTPAERLAGAGRMLLEHLLDEWQSSYARPS